ncbi:hypothetical protein BVY03_03025 [bacterium K02(2017)]|nr:hypothetical protein BVY03_03025 [bacterium K02(2017)]
MKKQTQKLSIFDTTLRDGAQTIGAHFHPDAKLQIAQQLIKLGVDTIEIGCPVASPQEFEVAKKAAKLFKKDKVNLAVFARAKKIDIDKAWQSIKAHPRPILSLLTSVSDVHLKAKFKKNQKEMLKYFGQMINYGYKVGFKKIHVYLEDGTRTDFKYIKSLVAAFIDKGVSCISIPDTVGFVNDPEQYGMLFSRLRNEIKIPKKVKLSSHTHNDKALAVANALAAIRHGVDQVECTINGLGERAGNASLGAILLNLYPNDIGKWSSLDYQVNTSINLSEYGKTAEMVGQLSGLGINYNEPLMGSTVFTTSAGIHQDGVIKDKNTYFCSDPERFGISLKNKLLSFNMLSGLKGIVKILDGMGLQFDDELNKKIYQQVIVLAQKKTPSIEDIRAIAMDIALEVEPIIEMRVCKNSSGVVPCTAEVVLFHRQKNKVLRGIGYGDGPFAAFMDITCELLKLKATILDYHDTVVGVGRDSQMQCFIKSSIQDQVYYGRGVSTDIVQAGCRAFLKCVNEHLSGK